MIAMALACRPKLLIADEPTTALDVTIQAQILDLLVSLRRQNGMALVLITHDMGVVAETADRVIVQYAGQQVEANTTRELFADPHHPYTAALLAALPERATQRRLPAIPGVVPGPVRPPRRLPVRAALRLRVRGLPARRAAAGLGRTRARALLRAADSRRLDTDLRAKGRAHERGASRRSRSRANMRCRAGCSPPMRRSRRCRASRSRWRRARTLAVVGESGSGKSTLARLLTLIETPTRGRADHRRRGCRRRRRGAAPAPAARSADGVPEPLRLAQSAPEDRQGAGGAAARQHRHERGASARRRRSRSWSEVGLRPEFYHRYPHMFSGGQRQRIAIARALVLRPENPRARRAGLRARRLDPRAGAQPARRDAGGIPARLCLRVARSLGRQAHRRRGDGDLSRPRRRDRRARRRSSPRRSIPIPGRCCRRRRSPSPAPSASG